MREYLHILKHFMMPAFLLAFMCCLNTIPDAQARRHAGGISPAVSTTCPNGTSNAALDGCQDASLSGLYQNTAMNDYFKDNNGNTATLAVTPGSAPGVPFNLAGRDFPIGPTAPFVYKDPALYSFVTTGSNVNGTTFTAGTVTSGTVRDGLILWSTPSSAGLLTNGPVLSGCTGGGGSGTVCTISISQTNKTGPYRGSVARGCTWTNGGAGVSSWGCDFRYPNNALTATFDHFEFGAVGGHTSSTLYVNTLDNGRPTIVLRNNHIVVDAQTNGQTIISGTPNLNMNWVFEFNECDGGNSSVATGAPPASFTYKLQSGCAQMSTNGTSVDPASVTFRFNWVHDWAGNPLQIALGNTTVLAQANVYYRLGMNNGNNPPCTDCTGLHGATINWNTTVVGATATLRRYNDVAIYPYGYRDGVTTAPFAVLGGVGSAVTVNYDQQLTTAIMNVNSPNLAISSQWINLFRVGSISNLNLKNNYVSTLGIAHGGCFNATGDIAVGNITGAASPSVGNGYTVWTVSGINSTAKEKPFPGQAIYPGAGSSARAFYATLTDLGNGTSQMDITLTVVAPSNDFQKWPIVGLGLANPLTNPTLITSQISPTRYIVNDGTGAGRTLSNRYYNIGFVAQAFGTNGTTATGGSNFNNYNGTWSLTGEFTAASSSNWATVGVGIGNYQTLSTDIANNFDVISGSALTPGGYSLGNGSCPGTNPG